jgi:hypothetical protein
MKHVEASGPCVEFLNNFIFICSANTTSTTFRSNYPCGPSIKNNKRHHSDCLINYDKCVK